MLDQPYMTDAIEASSMGYKPQNIDIYRWEIMNSLYVRVNLYF